MSVLKKANTELEKIEQETLANVSTSEIENMTISDVKICIESYDRMLALLNEYLGMVQGRGSLMVAALGNKPEFGDYLSLKEGIRKTELRKRLYQEKLEAMLKNGM